MVFSYRPVSSIIIAGRSLGQTSQAEAPDHNEKLNGGQMRENTLKQKLGAGQAVFGVMITFPSPQVVEMLGCLGFDWVLIDNEHGSITG